ncbi:hypothetical protein D3C80_1997590 [compost metagenome]
MYGVMNEVFVFAETFKQFPPRSFPPSFNPTTILQQTLKSIKAQEYVEKNVMPKVKEEQEAASKKKK